jgi:hypothetical protein
MAPSNIENTHINQEFEAQAVSLEGEGNEIVAKEFVNVTGLED